MPRNGAGLYSLPAGSIVTDGVDDILASQHNTPLLDIVSDMNAARPVVAGGTGAATAADARTNLGLPSDVIYQKSFETRAAFVTAVAGGYTAPTGMTVHAGGLAFVKVASGGISDLPGWQSARRLFVGETHIDVADAYNMTDNGSDGMTKMQSALDAAPIGAHLHIPPNFTVAGASSLVMSRAMQIVTHGQLSRVRLDTSNPVLDALQVAITDAGGFGDVRGLTILSGGGSITINGTGGNNAININPTETLANQKPLFGFVIENVSVSGRLGGIRVGGANPAGDTNFNIIRNCPYIAATNAGGYDISLDGCADGHLIEGNILSGQGYSVLLNLEAGAYSTRILGNVIKGQTGGIVAANADHVEVRGNQFELLGSRTGATYYHITMQGLARPCIGWTIEGNNFGAGTEVTSSILMTAAQQNGISDNHFNVSGGGVDIALGAGASYNYIGTNKRRGGTSGKAAPTDITRSLTIGMTAGATGNAGVWQNNATFSNSWTSGSGVAAFEFMKTLDGGLAFSGSLVPGTTTGGTIAATLPVGFAPRSFTSLSYADATGGVRSMFMNVDRQITVGSAVGGSPVYTGSWRVADAGLPAAYDTGA